MSHHLFTLTPCAKKDLADIARYTVKKWGKPQALKYASLLDIHFESIAQGKDISRIVFPNNQIVHVCRCKYHYIFYLKKDATPIILAVLHERMDLMERLKERLPS